MQKGINIIVRCPKCGWRICDKASPTSGKINVKCPKCRNIVQVDLSLRRMVKYRRFTLGKGRTIVR